MKKLHLILVAILSVQVLIFLVGFLGKNNLSHFSSTEPLLKLADKSVDKIIIKDENSKVVLEERGGKWILPDFENFPVSETKIDNLVENIKGLKREWPVAKTNEAKKQLKVGENEFEKSISFYEDNDLLGVLYLGTSPGFKKIHMRVSDEDEIYAMPFQSYLVSVDEKSWRDNDLFKLSNTDIAKVSINDFEVVNKSDGWRLVEDDKDLETNSSKVDALLSKITNINFVDVLNKENEKEYRRNKEALKFSVDAKGMDLNYSFSGPHEKDYYVLKRSDLPYYFKVNKSVVDSLTKFERKDLLKEEGK